MTTTLLQSVWSEHHDMARAQRLGAGLNVTEILERDKWQPV